MVRERYLEMLGSVNSDLEELCDMACEALERSVEYLEKWDKRGEERVMNDDKYINKAFIDLQEKCLRLIAQQQPVAVDMRFISSALTVANNIERTGDYASDIAQTVKMLKPRIKEGVGDIRMMEESAKRALRLSVKGFVTRDTKLTRKVLGLEKRNDAEFRALLEKMKRFDSHCKDHELLFRTVMIGRHLERFADRAVNITNRTAYVVTGDKRYLR